MSIDIFQFPGRDSLGRRGKYNIDIGNGKKGDQENERRGISMRTFETGQRPPPLGDVLRGGEVNIDHSRMTSAGGGVAGWKLMAGGGGHRSSNGSFLFRPNL